MPRPQATRQRCGRVLIAVCKDRWHFVRRDAVASELAMLAHDSMRPLLSGLKGKWFRLVPERIISRVREHLSSLCLAGLLLATVLLTGCVDHYVLHPRRTPAGAERSSEVAVIGDLRIRLEWVRPARRGPLPAVIVHPEAGHQAAHMRGVLNDLARAGYLAVAADYQRLKGNRWRQSLFPWQDPADPKRVIELVRAHPEVDPRRIGLLGFSQGGVFSLLIAAYDGGAAVAVAYYPVTDFESWLQAKDASLGRRLVFRLIRIGFRRASGARSDAELKAQLRRASAFWQAESITIPILLVHGDRDGSASVDESRRLAQRLAELKRPVALLVIHGAGHVFNFRDRGQASVAWAATLAFLDRHLQTGRSGLSP
jgi:dienelactone hydrolase